MPCPGSLCFSAFFGELARAYPKSLNVVALGNAPAHIASDVAVPENVVLLYLPAYSPELNPVERLWLAVRERIDVFDEAVRSRLEALRADVAEIACSFSAEEVARLTGYDYILDATRAL